MALDQPADFDPVFGGDIGHAGKVFLHQMTHIFAVQVVFAGQGGQKSAGQIGRQAGHFKMETGHILLADVGQHGIHQ